MDSFSDSGEFRTVAYVRVAVSLMAAFVPIVATPLPRTTRETVRPNIFKVGARLEVRYSRSCLRGERVSGRKVLSAGDDGVYMGFPGEH